MSGRLRAGSAMTRRRLLTTLASATAATLSTGLKAPALVWSAQRPLVTHGVQSGDISTDSGMVWARTDRPARMLIEAATTDSFENVCYTTAVDAIPETDFTAKALIEDLPSGQDLFYRLRLQDLSSPKVTSEPVMGHFRTAPYDHRSISFVWSGDTAGQGWGMLDLCPTRLPQRKILIVEMSLSVTCVRRRARSQSSAGEQLGNVHRVFMACPAQHSCHFSSAATVERWRLHYGDQSARKNRSSAAPTFRRCGRDDRRSSAWHSLVDGARLSQTRRFEKSFGILRGTTWALSICSDVTPAELPAPGLH